MSSPYRIFGAENSPFSVKTRSYFRYKGIPHEWLIRNASTQAEFNQHAKLPLVPLVLTPDGDAIQDSTPIIEKLEAVFPEPSIHPADPVLAFLSALLEEFGDEWGNKWMFHYRWARDVDQIACSRRLVAEMMPDLGGEGLDQMAEGIRARMTQRVYFVGSSEQTAPQIEKSFCDAVAILEAHFDGRPYLFGARPAFADFAIWGQIYNASLDPTPAAHLHKEAPRVCEYIGRMADPKAEGDFESWDALAPTLMPMLEQQVGTLFLPWSAANSRCLAEGGDNFSIELAGRKWSQKPQKYHARSLAAIQKKYAAVANEEALNEVLDAAGCLSVLQDAI
ncbi:MAG: glutathione S-transferase family protein [Myxococcota bacterium]